MEHLLEIGVCFTNHAHILPTVPDKCPCFWSGKFGFGQGKVREISGNFASYNLWEPWIACPECCIKIFFFNFEHKIVIFFLSVNFNVCFWCSKEWSH